MQTIHGVMCPTCELVTGVRACVCVNMQVCVRAGFGVTGG